MYILCHRERLQLWPVFRSRVQWLETPFRYAGKGIQQQSLRLQNAFAMAQVHRLTADLTINMVNHELQTLVFLDRMKDVLEESVKHLHISFLQKGPDT